MRRLRRLADRLIGLAAVIGSAGLLVEVVVILVDVVGRAFGHPLVGSYDLTTMTMVIVVFGGMALCDRTGGHVAVDILERSFPPALNRTIDVAAAFLGALVFAGIAWTVYDSSRISQLLNLSTNIINLPKAWFQWALAGFAALTAFAMSLRGLELAVLGTDVRRDGEDPA